MAFAPQSADVAYAGLYGDLSECAGAATVMRSDDGGHSWLPAADGLPPGSWADRLTFAPDGRLYAVLQIPGPGPGTEVGVFVSADGARSWTHVPIPISIKYTCVECGFPVPALAFDAKDPATLYLVGPGGLVRTRDSGKLWVRLGDSIEYADAYSVAVDSLSPKQLYLGLRDAHLGAGIYISHDDGATWGRAAPGLPLGLVVSPADPAVVWAVQFNRVTLSSSRGSCWHEVLNLGWPADPSTYPPVLLADAADPETAYVASWVLQTEETVRASFVKTTDGGRTWSSIARGLPAYFLVLSLTQSMVRPERLLLGEDEGLFLSEDGGETWTSVGSGLVLRGPG